MEKMPNLPSALAASPLAPGGLRPPKACTASACSPAGMGECTTFRPPGSSRISHAAPPTAITAARTRERTPSAPTSKSYRSSLPPRRTTDASTSTSSSATPKRTSSRPDAPYRSSSASSSAAQSAPRLMRQLGSVSPAFCRMLNARLSLTCRINASLATPRARQASHSPNFCSALRPRAPKPIEYCRPAYCSAPSRQSLRRSTSSTCASG
mmetsp:Transcript_16387/g.50908  ORF Transcript_16387/g.50908 Transcript_16387/m.50908 type:complete len:210 (+) Transcript_16387:690-1319(+)